MNDIQKKSALKNILENLKLKRKSLGDDEFINIENAKKEWEDAKNIFENVSHRPG